jgi:hypothetical protein
VCGQVIEPDVVENPEELSVEVDDRADGDGLERLVVTLPAAVVAPREAAPVPPTPARAMSEPLIHGYSSVHVLRPRCRSRQTT